MRLFKHRYSEVISEECRSKNYVYQKVDVYKVFYFKAYALPFWKFSAKYIKYYCLRTGVIGSVIYFEKRSLKDAYRYIVNRTRERLQERMES